MGVKIQISLYISPSSGLFFISPDEDLLFEVETSRVNFLVSFNSDDQRNTDVANHSRRYNIEYILFKNLNASFKILVIFGKTYCLTCRKYDLCIQVIEEQILVLKICKEK